MNRLFYGDNLEVLRKYVEDESVDLVYIDPPFNSKRNYNQIYNNEGTEDVAQTQAFVDTWTWDMAAAEALERIMTNQTEGLTMRAVALINGLVEVLGRGSMLAYLVSLTERLGQIWRVLKPTGSFYLHCDPTMSHYLKLVCDGIFLPRGGEMKNEIIWCYRRWTAVSNRFQRLHDVIFYYSKSKNSIFNTQYEPYGAWIKKDYRYVDEETGKKWRWHTVKGKRYKVFLEDADRGVKIGDWWQINPIGSTAKERLGYNTQKPEALLDRIIQASSNEGDVVMDCYCGCGTSVAVAQRLGRQWIGVDISYQSISLILRRLEFSFGKEVVEAVESEGIPRDMKSATGLANLKDDRLRFEFEKWAILRYTNNRGMIKERPGADAGVDGLAYIVHNTKGEYKKVVFSVKSGKNIGAGDVRDLLGTVENEGAVVGVLISLEGFTKPMREAANQAGFYYNELLDRTFPKIKLVEVRDFIEDGAEFDIPLALEVLKKAGAKVKGRQGDLLEL